MKVEVKEAQSNEVDWTKNPQLLTLNGAVIMTTINQNGCDDGDFAGVIVRNGYAFMVGDFSTKFSKRFWKPFNGEITLKND